MFFQRVNESPDTLAFQYPKGENGWSRMTWKETGDRVRTIACGLLSLGLELEQRVAILCTTRLEWVLADLGLMSAGGACTTIYPSNTSEECEYIINDSETRFVFAEDDAQVEKLAAVKDQLGTVKHVINMTGKASHGGWVITLADLEALGKKFEAENPGKFDEVLASVSKNHLATLIYTSGTTGRPKGVELIHDCWIFEAEALKALNIIRADDHQYLWLPLSHSFGKVLLSCQLSIGFSTTIDGRIPKLVDNLGVVRPTFMAAAPRIFEKVYNKVVVGASEKGGATWKIFGWAVGVGRKVSKLKQQRKEPSGLLALQYRIADKLVFSKLKARFGGRVRFFISGSAPLSLEMAEFFHAAGILILEGYGLTESSAASFVNVPDDFVFGTVGKPVPGVEVKIAEADGEILIRGRGIMRGYHNLAEVTAETLNDDRWLLTGDIGELLPSGHLKITDRKKDLIKTSGGKYVAPQKLEGTLKSLCPYLNQVLVHGNARNFCSALVTLDEEGIQSWAAEHGLGGKSIKDIAKDEQVVAMVQAAVDNLNKDLASYETIKKFAILPEDFTVENGLLTASLKVKRKVVETKYKDVLDGFYAGALKDV